MKKLIAVLVIALLGSAAAAEDDKALKEQMTQMRDGMVEIQDGFFYNKVDKIRSGVMKVEQSNAIFQNQQDIKKYLPANRSHMVGITFNTSTKINNHLKKMKTAIDKGQLNLASNEYAEVVNNCTSCHAIIRGW